MWSFEYKTFFTVLLTSTLLEYNIVVQIYEKVNKNDNNIVLFNYIYSAVTKYTINLSCEAVCIVLIAKQILHYIRLYTKVISISNKFYTVYAYTPRSYRYQ